MSGLAIYEIHLTNVLFLDIETVPCFASYDLLPDNFKRLWDKKSERIKSSEEETPDSLYNRAGIYAEFGKIICISIGYFHEDFFRVKSIFGDNEKDILTLFSELIKKFFTHPNKILCAHNGKEFDFPFIARRMLINGLQIPDVLNNSGKKPWEVYQIDTMELWKFGDYKNYTSLELLCALLDIPTPKDDIDGSMVYKVYWQDKDLERIAAYCQKDVVSIARILMKYKGVDIFPDSKILII